MSESKQNARRARSLVRDVVFTAGLGCVTAGVAVQFGLGPALITAGALLIALAVASLFAPEPKETDG